MEAASFFFRNVGTYVPDIRNVSHSQETHTQSYHPGIAPLFGHSSLWGVVENGCKAKLCVIGTFCSQIAIGAAEGTVILSFDSIPVVTYGN